MPLDSRIIRWLASSIYQHFTDEDKKLYVEGDELGDDESWAELRLTGPRIAEISKGYFKIEIDINIGCSVKLGNNIYDVDNLAGFYQNLCNEINIYKFADTDPAEYVGCLRLRMDAARPIDVVPFGRVQLDKIRVMHTTVDALYEMELTP